MNDKQQPSRLLLREGQSYLVQLAFLKGARRVLEIGCSSGGMSQQLVAHGHEVVGIECDSVAAAAAAAAGITVLVGDIEDRTFHTQIEPHFDAVLFGDVLEHLRNPMAVLQAAHAWRRPGGRVVISVPNAGHWIFRREVLWGRFPYRQWGLFDQTHLRFFTYTALVQMVTTSGYRIERQGISVNRNTHEDITFTTFTWLYRNRPDFRQFMIKLEQRLAMRWPRLFAYQFIFDLRPQ